MSTPDPDRPVLLLPEPTTAPGPRPLVELLGEGLATATLVGVGLSVDVQFVTGTGELVNVALGWGVAVLVAVAVGHEFGAGAHINPAITLALASFRMFPWAKVPGYVAVQLAGGFGAAALVRLLWDGPLRITDPELGFASQGALATIPGPGVGVVAAAGAELVGTAALLFGVLVILGQMPEPYARWVPLPIGLWVVGIVGCLAGLSGASINPARDLGPRLVAALSGYQSAWVAPGGFPYWWVPPAAQVAGGLLGTGLYAGLVALRDTPPARVPALDMSGIAQLGELISVARLIEQANAGDQPGARARYAQLYAAAREAGWSSASLTQIGCYPVPPAHVESYVTPERANGAAPAWLPPGVRVSEPE